MGRWAKALDPPPPRGYHSRELSLVSPPHFLSYYSHCPPLMPSLPQISSPFPCQNLLILCSLPVYQLHVRYMISIEREIIYLHFSRWCLRGKSLTQRLVLGRGGPSTSRCESYVSFSSWAPPVRSSVYDTVFDLYRRGYKFGTQSQRVLSASLHCDLMAPCPVL